MSDTSPITNLPAIGQLDLLRNLYEHIVIPSEVYGEMVGIGKVVPGTQAVQTLDWIETQAVVNRRQISNIQIDRPIRSDGAGR